MFKKPFSKYSYHIETTRLIFVANQFTGFSMIPVFTERSFRIVHTKRDIDFSYWQRLQINWRTKRFVLVTAPNFTDWLLHPSLQTMAYFFVILFGICSACAEYETIWTVDCRLWNVDLNILRKYKTFYKVLWILNIVQ